MTLIFDSCFIAKVFEELNISETSMLMLPTPSDAYDPVDLYPVGLKLD